MDGGAATITFTVEGTNVSAQTQVTCVDPEDYKVLKLPADLREVKRNSFFFTGPQMIILPEGCESVGENAFADCNKLLYILVPAGKDIAMADDAFDRDKVTVLEY